jgi:beta-phosphoglucomutase-like phosphatase (HAD superfamily)
MKAAAPQTALCVLFDVDGTLCDTSLVDDLCYRQAAAAALQITPEEADWSHAPHRTDSGIARWLWQRYRNRPPTREERVAVRRAFVRRLEEERLANPERFRCISGAPRFVEDLRRFNVRVGIGTGGWRPSAELKLAASGLDPALLHATADDHETRDEIFLLAWSRAMDGSARPATTLLIGDSICDVDTARRLGWRFLGIASDEARERLQEAGAVSIVPDYAGLDALQTIYSAEPPRRAEPLSPGTVGDASAP